MPLNCGAGEDSWQSVGLQGDQTYNPKGNQPWISTGRTDAKAEALTLWPPDAKSWLIKKTLMVGKIEGKRRRGWQKFEWCQHKPNEHLEIPADIGGWKRHGENSPLEPPAEALPYCSLGFRLLGSRTVGEYISVVSSQHGCDNLLQQLQETNTFGMICEACIWAAIRAATIMTSIYQTPLC